MDVIKLHNRKHWIAEINYPIQMFLIIPDKEAINRHIREFKNTLILSNKIIKITNDIGTVQQQTFKQKKTVLLNAIV